MKIQNFMHAGLGTIVSQIVTMVSIPFLFRLYDPADFASWAVTLSVVMLVGGVSTLRYELAVVIERDRLEASALFWLSLLFGVSVATLASLILIVSPISDWLFGGAVIPYLDFMIATWLILVAMSQALQGWALHDGGFKQISWAQIGNAVMLSVVQLIGGYHGGGAEWLIFGSVVGQLILLLILLRHIFHSSALVGLRHCINRIPAVAARYQRFPRFSVPYTLFTIVRERAAVIVLGNWAAPAEVGYYSQAWRIMNLPVGLSSSAIRPVLFHASADQGLSAQESRIAVILAALIVSGAPWLAYILYRPEDLFGVILGEQWRSAGAYAYMLVFPAFLFTLRNWMDRILDVAGRQDLNLLTEIVSAVTSIAAVVIVLASGATALKAVAVQSAILTVNYAVFIVVAYRIAGYKLLTLAKLVALLVGLVAFYWFILLIGVGPETDNTIYMLFVVPVAIASLIPGAFVIRKLQ